VRRLVWGVFMGLLCALAGVAGAVPASAAPGGVPGGPDNTGGGKPPGSEVIHVMKSKGGAPVRRVKNLTYHGGPVQTTPAVYLVFWGNQWTTGTNPDPSGEAARLQSFLGGLYASSSNPDTWSTSTTQYCVGAVSGSTNCNGVLSTNFVHQATSSALPNLSTGPSSHVWFDSGSAASSSPTQSQLAAEALTAASYFGVSNNPSAQVVVASPHGVVPQGFGTSYCAWHSYTSNSSVGTIAYTNLPYIPDAGAACGQNFVTPGPAGALDGVSIVGGHEYAEIVSDPLINAWLDQQGAENGDKCAWINSGQGAATNIKLSTGTFAVQSLWSNSFNSGGGGCVISYTNGGQSQS
jgi:hypothetical protein